MRAVRSVVFAMAALCAAPLSFGQEIPPENAVPPPGVEGVAVEIGAAQAGETIKANVGDKIAVELIGASSTGLYWAVVAQPAFLSAPTKFNGPLIAPPPGGRPLLGRKGWEVFVFTVGEAGTGKIKLEEHLRHDPQPAAAFDVTIEAQ